MTISTQYGASSNLFGHADYNAAKARGLSDLQILTWMTQNPSKLAGKNVPGGGGLYDEVSGYVTNAQNSTISDFENRINQQASQYQKQMRVMQEQMRQQQAAYERQAQMTANAQRAYTPTPEATATETTTADSGSNARRFARGGLSSLAIIEGLGTNANPLSGLQLA